MERIRELVSGGAVAVALCIAATAAADEQSQFDFANGLFTRGFYEDAAVEYKAYLKEFPAGANATDALFRLGECELAAERYKEAVTAFDQVLNRPDASKYAERARLRRAVALYESGDRAEAEIALKLAAEGPQTAAEAHYYLGKLYFDWDRPAEAVAAFDRMTRIAPANPLVPYARYQMAFALLKQADVEKAAVQFTEIANAENADPSLRVECRFRAAEAYDRLGWYDVAVAAYEALRRDYPESDYARRAEYGYAWSLYHSGNFAKAITAIEKFLADNPETSDRAALSYLRGNCLIQLARYEEAVGILNDLRLKHPESDLAGRAAFKVAWARHLAGDDDAALADLEAMLRDGKQLASAGDAAFLRGEILASRANFQDAFEEYRLVATQYPQSEFGPEALFRSGECLVKLGRYSEAVNAFDTYAVNHPDGPLASEAMLRSGDAAFLNKDVGGAVDRYSKLLARTPPAAVEEEGLFRLGIALHDISNFKMCAETLLKLLEKYPQSNYAPEAHLLVADVCLQDGKDAVRAIGHYQASLAASNEGPHAGDALKGLALARYEAKDYDGAADNFIELLRKFPAVSLNAETYIWLGDHFFQAKRWEDAIAAYGAFLERVPKHDQHALAWFRSGEAFAELGKTKQAIEAFTHVADVAPRSALAADAQLRIARQFEKEGNLEKAIALYEQSASANNGESSARARFKLGEIYEAAGDFDAAARQYMRVAFLYLHDELTPESLLRAGSCFARGGDVPRARKTWEELVNEFPQSQQADAARKQLTAN